MRAHFCFGVSVSLSTWLSAYFSVHVRLFLYLFLFISMSICGCLFVGYPHGLIGSMVKRRSQTPEFISQCGYIWRLFHLLVSLITFGGHLTDALYKNGRKISNIFVSLLLSLSLFVVISVFVLMTASGCLCISLWYLSVNSNVCVAVSVSICGCSCVHLWPSLWLSW